MHTILSMIVTLFPLLFLVSRDGHWPAQMTKLRRTEQLQRNCISRIGHMRNSIPSIVYHVILLCN